MMEYGQKPPEKWPSGPALEKLPGNAVIALARLRAARRERDGEKSTEIILDRTEGAVAQTHLLIPGGRAEMSDEELDRLWAQRQSRQSPQIEKK